MKQKKKYNEDAYRFAAAKICCRSAKLMTPAVFSSLCELESSRALRERLPECGILAGSATEDDTLETLLTAFLRESYAELATFLPDTELCALMQARFDCHNLKTAVKCRKAGLAPDPYYIDCGSVPSEKVGEAVFSGEYSAFPATLAAAAGTAWQAIAENASARTVDTLLDNACFAYMTEQADALGCRPVRRLLALKADLTNVITLFRIRNLRNTELARQLAADSFVAGGTISPEKLQAAEDNRAAAALLTGTVTDARLGLFLKAISADASVDDLAALADSIFYSEVLDIAKTSLLGIYPVLEYIIRLEYQVKNIRILSAGLDAGKSPDQLREELRSYV